MTREHHIVNGVVSPLPQLFSGQQMKAGQTLPLLDEHRRRAGLAQATKVFIEETPVLPAASLWEAWAV